MTGVVLIKDEKGEWMINHELITFLKSLPKEKFQFAYFTNSSDYWLNRILRNPSLPVFVGGVTGDDIKRKKPHPESYETLLKVLSEHVSSRSEVLLVDDFPENVDGSEKVGMKGFLYRDVDGFKRYLEKEGLL